MQRCTVAVAIGGETYREVYNGCPGRERRRMETMEKAKLDVAREVQREMKGK
ncbi:hypothetical protein ALC53_06112 [Atta colombica]|uniref:Uncharacterized protein n=1 Tax=Atta colombica TaxID=520822 RepID=A0A195BFM1_9HYME|nr:hypothetical protein ALC53_06112 [Atta colombica]